MSEIRVPTESEGCHRLIDSAEDITETFRLYEGRAYAKGYEDCLRDILKQDVEGVELRNRIREALKNSRLRAAVEGGE